MIHKTVPQKDGPTKMVLIFPRSPFLFLPVMLRVSFLEDKARLQRMKYRKYKKTNMLRRQIYSFEDDCVIKTCTTQQKDGTN